MDYLNPFGKDFFTRDKANNYEGLNYDPIDNVVWRMDERRGFVKRFVHRSLKLMVQMAIGVSVGLMSAAIYFSIFYILHGRIELFKLLQDRCNCFWLPAISHILIGTTTVALGAALVAFVEPLARSSGVAEIKSYLNGIAIPRFLRLQTFFVKAIALVLGLGGGVLGGKEEPIIHLGGILGASIPQGKSTTLGVDLNIFKRWRTDQDKRSFVSIGSCAGVAASFGSPVGSVMWGIEEGSSWWSGPLTASTFFAGVCAIVVVNLIYVGVTRGEWAQLSDAGLITYGRYRISQVPYTYAHFLFFALIGVLGGILGSVFNQIYLLGEALRIRLFGRRQMLYFAETVLAAFLVSAVAMLLVAYYPSCKVIGPYADVLSSTSVNVVRGNNMFCKDSEINLMASLFFQDQESAIQVLNTGYVDWSRLELLVVGAVYMFFAPWFYGTSIPNGIFTPTLIIGSCIGRIVALEVQQLFPELDLDVSGYAVIGSAAMMSGTTRLTVALAIILAEAVDNASFVLPMTVAVLCAKFVGDFFSHGIYSIQINANSLPMLNWKLSSKMVPLHADDVCSSCDPGLDCFPTVVKVITIYNALHRTDRKHNGFPLLDDENCVVGLIMRFQLIMLLKERYYWTKAELAAGEVRVLPLEKFLHPYPRYPTLDDFDIPHEDFDRFLDLRPYMSTPATVRSGCPLSRAYRLFRMLGLRHLVVVNDRNHLIGIITRKDLCSNVTAFKSVMATARDPDLDPADLDGPYSDGNDPDDLDHYRRFEESFRQESSSGLNSRTESPTSHSPADMDHEFGTSMQSIH